MRLVLLQVNSETDFAARDHQFMHVVRRVAEAAMRSSVGQGPGEDLTLPRAFVQRHEDSTKVQGPSACGKPCACGTS